MASSVDIANRALSKLGTERITSLEDPNKGARAMLARFEHLRDAELEAYPWRFAIARAKLPKLAAKPLFGYANKFQLPADHMRPVGVDGGFGSFQSLGVYFSVGRGFDSAAAIYEIVGNTIETDLSAPLNYVYVRQVENSGEFPPLFVEAFACRLAMDACEELTQSAGKYDRAEAQYTKTIKEAHRVNALYRPPHRRSPGNFMQSRIGWMR